MTEPARPGRVGRRGGWRAGIFVVAIACGCRAPVRGPSLAQDDGAVEVASERLDAPPKIEPDEVCHVVPSRGSMPAELAGAVLGDVSAYCAEGIVMSFARGEGRAYLAYLESPVDGRAGDPWRIEFSSDGLRQVRGAHGREKVLFATDHEGRLHAVATPYNGSPESFRHERGDDALRWTQPNFDGAFADLQVGKGGAFATLTTGRRWVIAHWNGDEKWRPQRVLDSAFAAQIRFDSAGHLWTAWNGAGEVIVDGPAPRRRFASEARGVAALFVTADGQPLVALEKPGDIRLRWVARDREIALPPPPRSVTTAEGAARRRVVETEDSVAWLGEAGSAIWQIVHRKIGDRELGKLTQCRAGLGVAGHPGTSECAPIDTVTKDQTRAEFILWRVDGDALRPGGRVPMGPDGYWAARGMVAAHGDELSLLWFDGRKLRHVTLDARKLAR